MALPSARYHRARNKVLKAVDKCHAEPIRICPLKNGDTDPDREIVEIEAVLRVNQIPGKGPTGGVSGNWKSSVDAIPAKLQVDRAVYADLIIKKGDTIVALSRPGQPSWTAENPNNQGAARYIIELSE